MVKDFFGRNLWTGTKDDFLLELKSDIFKSKKINLITLNPEIVLLSHHQSAYRAVLDQANYLTADGAGIILASNLLSKKWSNLGQFLGLCLVEGIKLLVGFKSSFLSIKEKITGVDLVIDLIKIAHEQSLSVLLLGGRPQTAEKLAHKFSKLYTNLRIIGNSQIKVSPDGTITDTDLEAIKSINPDFIFVALGAPKQELFIYQYLHKINNLKLAIGVGGAFDFLTGQVRRAPKLWQRLNIEWLWRLFNQPYRIFRILNATIFFLHEIYVKQKNQN